MGRILGIQGVSLVVEVYYHALDCSSKKLSMSHFVGCCSKYGYKFFTVSRLLVMNIEFPWLYTALTSSNEELQHDHLVEC